MDYDLSGSLDELLALAREKYDVDFEPVVIDDIKLDLLQFKDMNAYVDELAATAKKDQDLTLPFWAKLWPASMILSYFVKSLPTAPDVKVLEIGAGLGLVGLVAAARGFETTISDISEDALLFCQINILKNGLADKARVQKVDFTSAKLEQRYHYIIGCEVLYQEDAYRPLSKFLLRTLDHDPRSEAVLGMNYTRKAKKFFSLADKEFHVQQKVIGCSTKDESKKERHLCAINRFKPKKKV